uniref:FERM domain-containing protein n=1 Tax=Haemonchus placei TaxID=6290 RepID=A0A0N4X9N2_HAEPC
LLPSGSFSYPQQPQSASTDTEVKSTTPLAILSSAEEVICDCRKSVVISEANDDDDEDVLPPPEEHYSEQPLEEETDGKVRHFLLVIDLCYEDKQMRHFIYTPVFMAYFSSWVSKEILNLHFFLNSRSIDVLTSFIFFRTHYYLTFFLFDFFLHSCTIAWLYFTLALSVYQPRFLEVFKGYF